jgi:Domain of unknown function (DUF1877)
MGWVSCVSEDDAQWLRTHEVIWGDDVPEDLDDRSGQVLGGSGLPCVELGKASAGVHHLLTGGAKGGTLSFLENEELGEATKHEFAYGPGRLFPPSFIDELKRAMDALPDELVAARARDVALSERYPFHGHALDEGDRQWLTEHFDALSGFLYQAAEASRSGQPAWLLVAYT